MKQPTPDSPENPPVKLHHPEQLPDEIYLGNAKLGDLCRSCWKSSRLGSNPLFLDGTPYTGGDLQPWFIKRSEVQDQIERDRMQADMLLKSALTLEELLTNGKI